MSYGGIDIGILMELAKRDGYMYQDSLELTPPEYTVPEEYFVSLNVGYKKISANTGTEISDVSQEYHPGFERLRTELETTGYIQTERGWHNGDRVLKRFRLNGAWFEPGEKFASPYPCLWDIKHKLGVK